MRNHFRPILIVLMILGLNLNLHAQSKSPWLHLEVRENKGEPELVKVNLPISLLETALDIVKDKDLQNGRFKLDTKEISVAQMRQLWNEVKRSGNAEFVTVEKAKESVRLARDSNSLVVKVREQNGKRSTVDVKVPLAVVDALLSGEGDQLNLKAALVAMQQNAVGEILTVNDEETQAKLWIE